MTKANNLDKALELAKQLSPLDQTRLIQHILLDIERELNIALSIEKLPSAEGYSDLRARLNAIRETMRAGDYPSRTVLKGNATSSFLEQALEQAGLQPDDVVWVRVHPRHLEITAELAPSTISDQERTRRLDIVRRLYGIWSEDEATAFQRTREELWSQWQPHNWS